MIKKIYLILIIFSFFVIPESLFGQQPMEASTVYGGPGGNPFSDQPRINSRIIGIRIRAGLYIDSIQVFYDSPTGPIPNVQHGGNGGSEYFFNLNPNEFITRIGIRYGRFIDNILIFTNQRNASYGGPGGSYYAELVPRSGYHIIGFHGRCGALLDAIGIISAPY